MYDGSHSGDAGNQAEASEWHWASAIALDDAVLTSPVVVEGRVYVVDQMGAAYAIDPEAGEVLWRTTPADVSAGGANTSSPCVLDGVLAYGTTAGYFCLLRCADGQLVRSVDLGQPILGAVTVADQHFFLQTLDGVIHCFDGRGREAWSYDPYDSAPTDPGSRNKLQYSGVAVAVRGDRLVAAAGFDLVCLRWTADGVEHLWTLRRPLGDTYVPAGISLDDRWLYVSLPGKDGLGGVARVELASGQMSKAKDSIDQQWAVLDAPAHRDGSLYFCRHAFGLSSVVFEPSPAVQWALSDDDPKSAQPANGAPALLGDEAFFATRDGALAVASLDSAHGSGELRFKIPTPNRAVVTSSLAISSGAVYFGDDDGLLHIFRTGPGPEHPAVPPMPRKPIRLEVTEPAGDRLKAWPSTFGGPSNSSFVDDPSIRPPFRLRWATKCGGQFKQSVCATEQDVIFVTLDGLVECREQMTGRIRWRRFLPGQAWCRSGVLLADKRVYVPRMFSLRYPKSQGADSYLYCLSEETGEVQWQQPIGIGDRLRASPVYCQGVIAFGSLYPSAGSPANGGDGTEERAEGQVIDAWDAHSGERLWQLTLSTSGQFLNGPAGCASETEMYFTAGGEGRNDRGETVAVEPRTGKVLWQSPHFASQTGVPSYRDGRLYLPGTYRQPLVCLDSATGQQLWLNRTPEARWHVDAVALGPDFFSVNNKYRGGAWRWDLATGQPLTREGEPLQLWGPAHGCGAIVLTAAGHALSATIGGLCLTDVESGSLVWNTPGFASYTCPHPIAASGRIFYAPQTTGMLFCFEPVAGQVP
jgi:outer membrane protein assembly factor BamB